MSGARRARPPRLNPGAVISLRLAASGDDGVLEQLAELSGCVEGTGPWILAEVDGQPCAALSLAGGEALTDPFRPTAELCALLSLRAKQLGRNGRLRGNSERRRRRLRWTPALAEHSPLF